MRVVEGDVIGTKDGRYGEVVFIVTQQNFLLKEYGDIHDTGESEPIMSWTSIDNVASIR